MITKIIAHTNPRTVSHYGVTNISHLRYLIFKDSYFSTLLLVLFLYLFTVASSLSGVTHVDGYTWRDFDNDVRGPPGTTVTYHNITQSSPDKTATTDSSGEYTLLDLYSNVSRINPDNNTVMNYDSKIVGNKLLFGSNDVKSVKLFNTMGQELPCSFDVNSKGYTTADFNGQGIAEGVLFYAVQTGDGQLKASKFLYDKDRNFDIDGFAISNLTKHKIEEGKQNLDDIVNGKDSKDAPLRSAHTWDITYHSPDGKFFDSYAQETIENDQTGTTIVEFDHDLNDYLQVKDIRLTVRNGASYSIEGFDAKSPIEGVNVAVINQDGDVVGNATSGANGEVTIRVPTNDSWGSNQEDIMYTIELRSDKFRDNSFEVPISPRTCIADTVASQWLRKNIANNPQNSYVQAQDRLDQTMMPEAYEYIALDTNGERTVVNSELESYLREGMARMREGQCSADYPNDGMVFADDVMDRVINMYDLNANQLNSVRLYFNKFKGVPMDQLQGDDVGGYINQTLNELGNGGLNASTYDIQEGHPQTGINWDDDGNNTTPWNATYNLSNGNTSNISMGADINAVGNYADVAHEIGNLWNGGVTSEASFMNATAIPATVNDVISYQFMFDTKQNIFKEGIHTGTCTELGVNIVPDREYTVNPENTNK